MPAEADGTGIEGAAGFGLVRHQGVGRGKGFPAEAKVQPESRVEGQVGIKRLHIRDRGIRTSRCLPTTIAQRLNH
jgi:hypothetical protein